MRIKDIEKRNKEVVAGIENGATWAQLSERFGVTSARLQQCLKQYLSSDTRKYEVLLAIARTNTGLQYIDVAETGALLKVPELLDGKKVVYAPGFCKDEIKKIDPENKIVEDTRICWGARERGGYVEGSNLLGREIKPRTYGIVSFCCEKARNGSTIVRVHTNSKDVAELIAVQRIPNIKVIRY